MLLALSLVEGAFSCICTLTHRLHQSRYSDKVLKRLTAKNNGVREAEVCALDSCRISLAEPCSQMRIKSTFVAMVIVPPCYIAYAWTVDKHTSIAGPVVSLVGKLTNPRLVSMIDRCISFLAVSPFCGSIRPLWPILWMLIPDGPQLQLCAYVSYFGSR